MRCSLYSVSFITSVILFNISPVLANCPPQPRLSVNGYASDHAIGEMDLMIPISGDRLRHTYFNPAIAYGSDNQGYADIGLGHRWIHNCQTLLGVYLFGGYTRVEHDAHLWVANPGIEAMGRRWDAHLNGYLSMGDKNYHYQDGYNDNEVRTGHQLLTMRQLSNDVYHTGNGLDLKFGYQLFSNVPLRGYVGGYYFHAHEVNSIGGGAVGLEYWLDDHIKSFAHYTYDNVHHSTGAIGLGIELGGTRYHRSNPCIEERLTDPIERYLAELGHGSALPGESKHNLSGEPFVARTVNNIAYFSQTGSPNDGSDLTIENCTFENPCGPFDLTQPSVDDLNNVLPETSLYFNGGQYINPNDGAPITLNPGQSLHSRTLDYSQPATGSARTTLILPFIMSGNNTIENLIITNDEFGPFAVEVHGLNNQIIGSELNSINEANCLSIIPSTTQASSITIQDSLINIQQSTNLLGATGIIIINSPGEANGIITLINSEVNVNISDLISTNNAYGIEVIGGAPAIPNQISLTNTKIDTIHAGAGGNNSSFSLNFINDITNAANSQFTVDSANPLVSNSIAIGAGTPTITITNGVCTINGSIVACP